MKQRLLWLVVCTMVACLTVGAPGVSTAGAATATAARDPASVQAKEAAPADESIYLNTAWTLLCASPVFFMRAVFACGESGMTRAKNVAHTIAMNVMFYAVGALGFWAARFA